MPPRSEKQRKAMHAAAAGKGITDAMIAAAARALVDSGQVHWNLPDWSAQATARDILEAAFDADEDQGILPP